MEYTVNVDKPTNKALVHFTFCKYYQKNGNTKDSKNGYWTEPIRSIENAFAEAHDSGMDKVRWAECCEIYFRLNLTVEAFHITREENEQLDHRVLWESGFSLAYRSAFYHILEKLYSTGTINKVTVRNAVEYVKSDMRLPLLRFIDANMHRSGLPNPRRDIVNEGLSAALTEIVEKAAIIDQQSQW